MANQPRRVPTHKEMMEDVLFPVDGMPRDGKRRGNLSKDQFRLLESKNFTAFETKDKNSPWAKLKAGEAEAKAKAKSMSLKELGDPGAAGALEPTLTQVMSRSESEPFKPRYFLQRGFGLGDRVDIVKCFGSNGDCVVSPGDYNVHEIGMIRWDKDSGSSHPAQMVLTNHKSPGLASFGKFVPASTADPPLRQAPGPGHYEKPDYWDPFWQRYPALGRSFVRKLPPQGESRFGVCARQELRNSKGNKNFLS